MKKILVLTVLLVSTVFNLSSREYSYLSPPSISIMDFDVNMREGKDDNFDYYGKLINQTLLTILIQKNSSNEILIDREERDYVVSNEKDFEESLYFPTLFKIYDKKYVETALSNNNYTTDDLYTKKDDAFSFADLDFVVLGNVYDTRNYIGLNVRVLNTFRGEELFSYVGYLEYDMTNLLEVCDEIAENIITDILKNYCSQFIIKETESVPYDEEYLLFCQSSQEYDNENITISANDTFKKDVDINRYYWTLPGDYIMTVYSKTRKSVQEIPVTINPREIKLIELTEDHFEVAMGTLTIGGIFPVDAYSIRLEEKERDAEYLWELGEDMASSLQNHLFTFSEGEFYETYGDEHDPQLSYNPFSNEILISNLMISKYDVTVTPVAKSISKKSITGIVYISSREIETSEIVPADLYASRDAVLNITDFDIKKAFDIETYKQTRVTFLFPHAFNGETTHLTLSGIGGDGYLMVRNIEKLVIEDEYNQEEWESLSGGYVYVNMFQEENLFFDEILYFSSISAEDDLIVVVDFEERDIVVRDRNAPPRSGFVRFFRKLFGMDK